jgi:hypothetical protein
LEAPGDGDFGRGSLCQAEKERDEEECGEDLHGYSLVDARLSLPSVARLSGPIV